MAVTTQLLESSMDQLFKELVQCPLRTPPAQVIRSRAAFQIRSQWGNEILKQWQDQ